MRIAVVIGALVLMLATAPAHALQDGVDRKLATVGQIDDLGDTASDPAIARNTKTGEFLLVYTATEEAGADVRGQRLSPSGVPVGPELVLAGVGVDADAFWRFPSPAVAYSETSDTWMVVFSIDDQQGGRPDEKYEIFARTVTGAGTVEPALTRVSGTAGNVDPEDDAEHPAIAWDRDLDQFLIAWEVRPQVGATVAAGIWTQRLAPNHAALGVDVRISATGGTGGDTPRNRPDVAYDTTNQRWLVTWFGEPTPDSFRESEIFGQLVTPLGVATGPDDFRITQTGTEGDEEANAGIPPGDGITSPTMDTIHDPATNEFTVTYAADPASGGLVNDWYEIFAQRVTAAGARSGDAVRISETAPDDTTNPDASWPAIDRDPVSGESLVIWQSVPGRAPFATGEREIFGQRLAPGAVPLGPDFRVGQTGPDGEPSTIAAIPALASRPGGYQGAWLARPTAFKTDIWGDQLHVPSLSLGDLTVPESVGTAQIPLTVTDPDPAGVPIGVSAATASGSATAPADFTALTTSLVLPALASAGTFDVPIIGDTTVEPGETFTATLGAPVNAIIGDGTATVTIADDDTTPSGPGPGPGTATTRDPAKLQVLRAQVRRGRLDVLAQITARATGAVRISFRSGGRTTRFTATIAPGGRIRVDRLLPAVQRRRTTGILSIAYGGNARVRPDDLRLRAASGRARLTRDVTRIRNRRLEVSGTISRAARGVVRLRLAYVESDGEVTELTYRARISIPRSGAGRWSIREALPARAAAVGGQLDIQFTGYEPRLIRGEQLSKQVP